MKKVLLPRGLVWVAWRRGEETLAYFLLVHSNFAVPLPPNCMDLTRGTFSRYCRFMHKQIFISSHSFIRLLCNLIDSKLMLFCCQH